MLTLCVSFPMTWRGLANAADLVCCWGRCCGDVKAAGTPAGSSSEIAPHTLSEFSGAPVAPLGVTSPAAFSIEAQPTMGVPITAVATAAPANVGQFLQQNNLSQFETALASLGAVDMADLRELQDDELAGAGLKVLEIKRLRRGLA